MSRVSWQASEEGIQLGYVDGAPVLKVTEYTPYGDRFWSAYFMPEGWNNFGNACRQDARHRSVQYPTLELAKQDAELHLSTCGVRPSGYNRLPYVRTAIDSPEFVRELKASIKTTMNQLNRGLHEEER